MPDEVRHAVDPQADPCCAGLPVARRYLDVVHTPVAARGRVRDRVTRRVELMGAVLLGIRPAAGRGESPLERHVRQLAQRLGRSRARRPGPSFRLGVH